MITMKTYTCEYCGETFDEEIDCATHEILCECRMKMEEDSGFVVKFFDQNGDILPMDFRYLSADKITAVYASSTEAIDWVTRFYDFEGYYGPWREARQEQGLMIYLKSFDEWISPREIIDTMNSYLEKYKIED